MTVNCECYNPAEGENSRCCGKYACAYDSKMVSCGNDPSSCVFKNAQARLSKDSRIPVVLLGSAKQGLASIVR
jgi:hypothetical protein